MAAEFEPCATWADPETFSVCEPGNIRPELLADAISLATSILYVRTGRAFPGPCPDVWRPTDCRARCLVHSTWCTCVHYPAVKLRFAPVTSVTEVRVDGVVIPSSAWRLGDPDDPHTAGWLFRVDGGTWPHCQNIALAVTEPGTWQISYPWGEGPPAGADLMTEVLSCEFVKAWTGDKTCRLPGRWTTITRENLTATRTDPAFLLAQGLTGVPEVDAWVAAVNPGGVDRPPKVLNPDLMGLGHDPTVRHRGTPAHRDW